MLEFGFKCLLAYLLGSILGSLLVGRLRGGVDIRTQGSGNAGGTNALRTQGFLFAFWVMLIDIGKGVLAVTVVPALAVAGDGFTTAVGRDWVVVGCAVAVVLGHVWPVWHDFRGGKGAATLVGVLAGLMPGALIPVLSAWIIVVMVTGYVGLATVIAAVCFPMYLWLQAEPPPRPVEVLGVLMALLVLYTHRGNIRRMLAGNEHRARRLWLLRPR